MAGIRIQFDIAKMIVGVMTILILTTLSYAAYNWQRANFATGETLSASDLNEIRTAINTIYDQLNSQQNAQAYTYVKTGNCYPGDTVIAYRQQSKECCPDCVDVCTNSDCCTTGGTSNIWSSSSITLATCQYGTSWPKQTCTATQIVLCQANIN